jgi:hypothetical protein
MDRLLALYRAALRMEHERADRELQELPRQPPRPSAARERALQAVLWRLRSYLH